MSDVRNSIYDIGKESLFEWVAGTTPTDLHGFLNASLDHLIQHGVGLVTPRIGTIILSFKQTQLKRNIEEMQRQIHEISQHRKVETRPDDPHWLHNAGSIIECSIDAVIDERDIDKVRYFALGTVRAFLKEELDPILHEYLIKLLKQCSIVDMILLREALDPDKSDLMHTQYSEWMQKHGLTEDTVSLSVHNLRQLGLFKQISQEKDEASGLTHSSSWNEVSNIGQLFATYFHDWAST